MNPSSRIYHNLLILFIFYVTPALLKRRPHTTHPLTDAEHYLVLANSSSVKNAPGSVFRIRVFANTGRQGRDPRERQPPTNCRTEPIHQVLSQEVTRTLRLIHHFPDTNLKRSAAGTGPGDLVTFPQTQKRTANGGKDGYFIRAVANFVWIDQRQ